jgi:hypothetical protein
LNKQEQLVIQTEIARKSALHSVIVAWAIPCLAAIGWLIIFVLDNTI